MSAIATGEHPRPSGQLGDRDHAARALHRGDQLVGVVEEDVGHHAKAQRGDTEVVVGQVQEREADEEADDCGKDGADHERDGEDHLL